MEFVCLSKWSLDFEKLKSSVNLESLVEQSKDLEEQTNSSGFWSDSEKAKMVVKKSYKLRGLVYGLSKVAANES